MSTRTRHDLTVKDAAAPAQLNVTPGTVRRYIKSGYLHAYKLPHDPNSETSKRRAEWRIPEEEIERIKNERAATPAYDRDRFMRALRG